MSRDTLRVSLDAPTAPAQLWVDVIALPNFVSYRYGEDRVAEAFGLVCGPRDESCHVTLWKAGTRPAAEQRFEQAWGFRRTLWVSIALSRPVARGLPAMYQVLRCLLRSPGRMLAQWNERPVLLRSNDGLCADLATAPWSREALQAEVGMVSPMVLQAPEVYLPL